MNEHSGIDPASIVAFWRDAGTEKWFRKDAKFDRAIAERFAALHGEAAAGRLNHWAETAAGALALILLLDQFSRNIYRGDPRAFAQDELAASIARKVIDEGLDQEIPPDLRFFFYLPFEHSESIADQKRSLALFHYCAPHILSYAKEHERIIWRFGRFPHRNVILGRHTSPAEQAFLDGGGFAG